MDYRLRQDADEKLSGEIGTIYKSSPDNISVVLVYPNTYYIGMSNLGFQAIYGFLNARDDVSCERAFLPDRELIDLYKTTKTPVFSLETKKPLSEFDIIAFSVSFENDYLNILRILELARVPLKSEERTESEPLVLLGGAVTTINPEPLAMFFDICIIGDGEIVLDKVIDTYYHLVTNHSKQELLDHLADISGVYVPSCYQVAYDQFGHVASCLPKDHAPKKVEMCQVHELARYPAYARVLTEKTEFGNMFLLQINRGCAYKCRFCHTGYAQSPLRHLALDVALRLIQQGLQYRDTIGLVSSALAEYPYLQDLCEAVAAQGGKISASSLRLSALPQADYFLDALIQAGQKTITLAPEAGTERLRTMIRKGLSDERLYNTIEQVVRKQIPNLKLYFLVGLPTETDEDIEAIITVCKKCGHLVRKTAQARGSIGKITISVNPCVPKPFTPLQWCAMDSEAELKRKIRRIASAVSRIGNMDMIYELPKWAVWQGILARGDRKLGHVLLLTLQYQGDWKRAFRELNMNPGFYAHRIRGLDEKFPWDHVDVGLSDQYLRDEYHSIAGVKG